MISWIQRNFQQHFRAIFAVLLAVIIISFIATIGASPGIGRGDHTVLAQPFFGYNLGSPDDQHRLFGDAGLSIFLRFGVPAGSGPQMEGYAFQRAAMLSLADQLHIGAPPDAVLADYVKTFGAFADSNGQFDPKLYASFRDNQTWAKIDPRFTIADVSRVISDDWRANQVGRLIAGPGYVPAGDIKTQLSRDDTQWTLGVATTDYAGYAPSLTTNPKDVESFFEENSARYLIPARVSASYVTFPAADFVSQVSITDAEVRAYYDANPARFPKPADAKKPATPVQPNPDADFAAVRPQVEAAARLDRAQHLAAQAASDFAVTLYNQKINGFTPDLDAFLSGHHLTLKSLAPFTADAPPAELGSSPELADEAFKLGPDHFFSDALTTPTGSVVLLWKETIAAHKPLFPEVQAQVTSDYKENQKRSLFINQLGKNLQTSLAARLKAGDTFDKAAAAAAATAGVKLEVKNFGPFSQRQPPHDIDSAVTGNLERLAPGQVSDLIFSQNKGYFVYVAAKKLPDLAAGSPQFVSTHAQLASTFARDTLSASLGEMITKEQKRSAPAETP